MHTSVFKNYVQTSAFKEERNDKNCLSVVLLLVHMQLMLSCSSSDSSAAPLSSSHQLSTHEVQSLIDLLSRLLPKHLINLPALVALRVALILNSTKLPDGKQDMGDGTTIENMEKARQTALLGAKKVFSESLIYWSANESKVSM